MTERTTVGAPVGVRGVGLFTGNPVDCTILPAKPGEGIRFRRTDRAGAPPIPASIEFLCDTPVHPVFAQIPARNTGLVHPAMPDAPVFTTEHVLAAFVGLGITDATIELDAPELPIDDGSADAFVKAVQRVGVCALEGELEPLVPRERLTVTSPDGVALVEVMPLTSGEAPSFEYRLDYSESGSPIPAQDASWTLGDSEGFVTDVAPARTFSLQSEASQMQAMGLFKSFTPKDLLVIAEDGTPIDNAWRFENESARHKVLDLIGDLSLVGRPVHARVVATRAGHALNHQLAHALTRI